MKKIIHHLRKQPEKTRRHISHLLVLIFGLILVSLWIYSLGASLTNPDTQAKAGSDLKPLSVFKDNIISGYNSISGSNSTDQNQ